MKRLLLLICLPLKLFSQNTIGLPDVVNYSKQTYNAGFQNWDIKQDRNGILYFANNEGLLSFDGRNWNLYSLPNKTIVRSVEIAADHKIYVGGQDELGYFSPGNNGRLQYHSFTALIPEKDKSFGDVWDIVSVKNDIYFRSHYKIFKFTNEAVAVFTAPSEWSYLGLCNDQLYAHDYKSGIMRFENNVCKAIAEKNELPTNDLITSMLPLEKDSILITTLKHGLYILSKTGIAKLPTVNSALFENERIYATTAVNKDWLALATNNSGIYIVDHAGNIMQKLSKTEGLQNNNVLSIFLDRQNNLWLGLDNGIDLIAYNSAIKQISPMLQDGSGYSAIIHQNRLFAGTTNGLYSVALQAVKDLSFSKGMFLPVNNTKGQVWGLSEINNQLLLGHHEGAFEIKDNSAQPISSNPGFWNFIPISTTFPTSKMVAGNYNGLVFFDYKNGQFIPSGDIPDFKESSRFVAIDKNENIWVSHPYHGVYKISKKNTGAYTVNSYTDKNGLPTIFNNHVYKINNEVVFATEKGIFIYNAQTDRFEQSAYYKDLLGDQSIRYLKEDAKGNTWFVHEKKLGVIDISGKQPVIIYLPELNNKILSGFEFIYPVDENNIFIGGEKGFYHIDFEKYKKSIPDLKVNIRSVHIINKTDSLLFGGYFKNVNEQQIQESKNIPAIENNYKTIRFEFSAALFGFEPNLEYSYRLKGFEQNWSEWAERTEKEYTNLAPGKHNFEVRVRSNLGNESESMVYSFIVLPPWYQSLWARIAYLLLIGAGLYTLYKWQHIKFNEQQVKYENEQKNTLYVHELELNKTASEMVVLQNEKLEAEVNYKNAELASSAMHLVKKGELFTKIKGELTQVMKGIDNPEALAELRKMIKTLSEDDNMEQEWENFTKHFDKVNSDFLTELKDKHPGITPNELKLCAYLRMNLTTKEIAQLMNISVRGVEISRYRLRKKLQIPSELNLFDYLVKGQTKT